MTLPSTTPTTRPRSLGQMLVDRVAASGDREAIRYLDNGVWTSLTWNATRDRAFAIGAGLIALGVQPEDRVAIAAGTRVEWMLADLGVMCAAAATTTIYPSTSADDFVYITADSGSRVLIAENQLQVDKIWGSRDQLPDLLKVVVIDGAGDGDGVITLAELEALGTARLAADPDLVHRTIAAVKASDLATLIYTSGTTGRPKGVRLIHESWAYIGEAVEARQILFPSDVQYLWLPLSHVFGKVLIAVQLRIGFITAVEGNLERIVEYLGQVKPTFMAGAPRIFEKVRARVTMTAQGEGGIKAKIFDWAIGVGIQYAAVKASGKSVNPLLTALHGVAQKLVFSKVQHRLGGNIRFFVSGSAALSAPVAEWFEAVGMPILQGYGLTETSAGSCLSLETDNVIGVVGPPLAGTEVKIAADGEILIKGPGVMDGYHNQPAATAEVLDADGWFATGDIGELTDKGYLRVTDRKKDLIKTSGGKYVAPQKIEILFKAVSPYANHIVVHGESRKFCSALITLDPDSISVWAKEHGLADRPYELLTNEPAVRQLLQQAVDQLNASLERWETIKKFQILTRDLTIEAGELTPSMKVRRKYVEREYKELLDSLYTD